MTHESETPAAPVDAEHSAPETPRRGFLQKGLAVLIGGFITLFPFATGLAVFLDPLRSRKRAGGGDADGFIKVAALDDLLVGKAPRRYTVIDDRVDAWNMFPQEPIGAIFLLRPSEKEVLAFNADCPHATCPVSFDRDRQVYQCPCHNSSFKPTGEIANPGSPAARGLDRLQVKLEEGNVWIKFQNFQPGIAEQVPIT